MNKLNEDIHYYRLRMDNGNKRNCHHHDIAAMLANTDDIDNMKFIKIIQKQEILYDRKSTHFTNEHHKQHVWKEIANKFKCSAADCMAKWMILRQRFIREKEKEIEREMKLGKLFVSADEIKSKWKYMEAMRFMEPHVTLRIPSSIAMNLPERFPTVSKQSTQKLPGHGETQEDLTQKNKCKSSNKPDSKPSCRKHLGYVLSNIQFQQELQQDQKAQNKMAEQEISQQKDLNILLDNKDAVVTNNKTKSMITSFLVAKQNRMKSLDEGMKSSRKSESVKQTQDCQPLIQEDVRLKIPASCRSNTHQERTQSMILSNSAPNSLYTTSTRKLPRHEETVTRHFTSGDYNSYTPQMIKKSKVIFDQCSPQRIPEQTSATQTLPLIREEDKNVANLTSMVTQLIDIVQSVHKTQTELLDVNRSTLANNSSVRSCIHKSRCGTATHKLNSGASLAANFTSSSFNNESFTSEELFGRLIASEISQLDSEALVNNAKLLILKIIYKLRLGEHVTL